MCRRVVTGQQKEPVLRTAQAFWCEPEKFIDMMKAAGFTPERHFPQGTLDATRQPINSPTRHDYVFSASKSQP
jgi:hypothetical protein